MKTRWLLCILTAVSWAGVLPTTADSLSLAGPWRLRLDPRDEGLAADWPAAPLKGSDRIVLPNTTDLAGFGAALDTNTLLHTDPFPVTTLFPGVREPSRADERGTLVRRHLFVGPAWYEREMDVPAAWLGRPVTFEIERSLWQTDAWVDGRHCGTADSLVAKHRHELGTLTPGRHRLTVRVDNRMIYNLSTITHAYGPETQSRWNGLLGAITLKATPPISIRSTTIFPAPDRLSARVRLHVANRAGNPIVGTLRVALLGEHRETVFAESSGDLQLATDTSTHEITLRLAEPAQAWDEFHPVRYRIRTTLEYPAQAREEGEVLFGFRHAERMGTTLLINGRRAFLRGTLDCAVYPNTGHPPLSVPEWERVLGVVKEYGFNHVRFHTWCPPEAAFEAADRLGVYLQAEAPAWVDDWGTNTITRPQPIGHDPRVTDFLRRELRRMSDAYGHHPSFLLCAIGNEFGLQGTDWDQVNQMVEEIRAYDPRRLYTGCGARRHLDADDFWFTHNSGATTRGVGPPHTDWDFSKAAAASPVPLIAHETGQRPVFPDYETLLPKFTGPLVPLNLARYHRDLLDRGLGNQLGNFVRASARFQLTQYKAEHEAMLRTRGYAGYQLLMLNDFTGQSEALVGILDPFWESKGVVTTPEVRRWNAPTVLLARFTNYVWTTGDTLNANIEVAHFGAEDLPPGPVSWAVQYPDGTPVAQGLLPGDTVPAGSWQTLGSISVSLDSVSAPSSLNLAVHFGGTTNQWNLWVYPTAIEEPEPTDVLIVTELNDTALRTLEGGGKVLVLAQGIENSHTAKTGFESVYWSAGWWGNSFSSLGLLCDPEHPALEAFPTEAWSDWQWQDLRAGATTFECDGAPPEFRPIVQSVPDFHFNRVLAQFFEGKVGRGSVLVCGFDLKRDLDQRPAARQFRQCLLRYVGNPAFRPTVELPIPWLVSRCANNAVGR